jgi:hypothetical protein
VKSENMNFYDDEKRNKKNLIYFNNNNMDKDPTSLEDRASEDFQNFNDPPESDENENDSADEMFVNSDEEEDVQLSSPSNSLNSDVDQRWYAFRGQWDVNMIVNNNANIINNRQVVDNQPEINQPPNQPQEEEETDFLEMDFEPDTNSEIENEAKFSDYVLPNGHASNSNSFNYHNHHPPLPLPQISNLPPAQLIVEPDSFAIPVCKNTGAKPKQLQANRPQKTTKQQVSDGDNVFKLCTVTSANLNSNNGPSSSLSSIYTNGDEIYNIGASSSRAVHLNDRPFSSPTEEANVFMKIHKSPLKSSSHNHNHKHLRLHEEQNDQFLFEIEPLKPRNSVTIYTTNCDEKILIDALVSFLI